jgi:hypothetical protein
VPNLVWQSQIWRAVAELLFRLNVAFNSIVLIIMTSKRTNAMEQSPSWEAILIQLIKKLPPFMEPEGLLPNQDPAPSTCLYPYEFSSILTLHFWKIHFNSILASTFRCPSGMPLLLFRFSRCRELLGETFVVPYAWFSFRPVSRSTFVCSGRWLNLD